MESCPGVMRAVDELAGGVGISGCGEDEGTRSSRLAGVMAVAGVEELDRDQEATPTVSMSLCMRERRIARWKA